MQLKELFKKKYLFETTTLLVIALCVLTGVISNIQGQRAIDRSKLPEKVELNKNFQRWLTNLKNKDLPISADEFVFVEDAEIYNTKWIKVLSADDQVNVTAYEENLARHADLKKVVFSPSGHLFIDIRPEIREGYNPNEAHFYGLLDNKILDARILDCSVDANCFFDRAYFIENDIFIISELSRNIDKRAQNNAVCTKQEMCTYTFKLHLIDLKNNKRLVYESASFEGVWDSVVPEL